jgi:hypothetical protein
MNEINTQNLTDEQLALSLAVKSTNYHSIRNGCSKNNTVQAITERASEFLKWL